MNRGVWKAAGAIFRPVAALLVSALFFTPAAWSQAALQRSWPTIVNAAKKEGKVVFYATPAVPVMQRVVDGFKKAYPDIQIEFSRLTSGAMISRIDQEVSTRTDGADVAIHTDTGWFLAKAKEGKLLKPIGPAASGWPSDFILENSIITGAYEWFVIGYNKNLVPTPPKSYADVLRPELRGKLGIPSIVAGLTCSWYDWLDRTQGNDYLARLKALTPKIYTSGPSIAQALGSGEIAASPYSNPSSMKPIMAEGAPIDFVSPNPAHGFQIYAAALGWSTRPNAAIVLVDYLMSRDGQTAWNGSGDSASALKVPGSLHLPANVTFYNFADWPPEAFRKCTERWQRTFK